MSACSGEHHPATGLGDRRERGVGEILKNKGGKKRRGKESVDGWLWLQAGIHTSPRKCKQKCVKERER